MKVAAIPTARTVDMKTIMGFKDKNEYETKAKAAVHNTQIAREIL